MLQLERCRPIGYFIAILAKAQIIVLSCTIDHFFTSKEWIQSNSRLHINSEAKCKQYNKYNVLLYFFNKMVS